MRDGLREPMRKLKGGEVVTIRVNPEDVMACIDVVDKAEMYTGGMSLSMCIKAALAILLQSAREAGVVQARDGFEYSDMVVRFTNPQQGSKLRISDQLSAPTRIMPAVSLQPQSGQARSAGAEDLFDELVKRKGRLLTRVEEMRFKMKADPLNFGKEEQLELDNIEQQVRELDGKLEELA